MIDERVFEECVKNFSRSVWGLLREISQEGTNDQWSTALMTLMQTIVLAMDEHAMGEGCADLDAIHKVAKKALIAAAEDLGLDIEIREDTS